MSLVTITKTGVAGTSQVSEDAFTQVWQPGGWVLASGAVPALAPYLHWRDVWASGTTYYISDVVSYSGSLYVALGTNTSVTPGTDATKWKVFMAAGGAPPSDMATTDTVQTFTANKSLPNVYVKGVPWVSALHPDFTALGVDPNFGTDSTAGLQAAIDFCMTSGPPATTARQAKYRLHIPPGLYKITSPLKIWSADGFELEGAGKKLTTLQSPESATFENILDLNGFIRSSVKGLKIVPCQFAGQITCGIDWYWDFTTSAYSASSCSFEDIWIVGRFVHGFGVSRRTNAGHQCDHGHFMNVLIDGGTQDDPAIWQNGWLFGSGTPGNQTNYDIRGWSVSFCKNAIKLDGAKSVWFQGGGAGGAACVVYNAGYDFVMRDFECEGIGRLYDMPGASGASQSVEFANGEIQPLVKFVGSSVDPAGVTDGEIVRHYVPGVFKMRNVRMVAGPAGVTPRMRFNTATGASVNANGLTVILDGLTAFGPPNTLIATPTYLSGPAHVVGRGYQQLDLTTQLVTEFYPEFALDPNPRKRSGTVTLNGTTSVVINTAAVKATSQVRWSMVTPGGTVGAVEVSKTANTSISFRSSSASDTSILNWWLVESLP